jgi:hypothetical protein
MREKLNDNPVAQIAVIGVLILVVGVFALKSLGGGSEEEGESAAPVETATAPGAEAAPGGSLEESTQASAAASVIAPTARPLPDDVEAAYERGETIALFIYRPGGIDDKLVTDVVGELERMPGVALFTAPAGKIADYAPITGPLGVNQAPALIVISPRSMNGGEAAPATVTYGFQSVADLRQAVIDAGYRGPELTYAPK